MSPRTHSSQLRLGGALLLLAALALHALFPRTAWAACGPVDLGACMDNAEYSFYYLVASSAWNVNRWLLLLAYQLDQLRAWLIDVAFSGAYQWLTSFVQPVYMPIATAALMLAAILFMLVPLTGQTSVVNLRHVLIWAVMTPVVLAIAGQLIGQAEQVRSDIATRLFTQMSQVAPGAIFGAQGSDMPAPTALYPANPCGGTLVRTTTTGLAMDALAATLVYGDAGDIHCPDARGPSRDIPDGFYNSPPAYAYEGSVGDLDAAVERRGWVEGMQRGMNRLLQAIIPSFLAVLESLIHLVFSLSMAVLWLSLPIGLIFVWFQQTASPVSSVLRRAASVLITSWMASMLMGVISAALVAAAQLGNAGAYTGMALGGLFLLGYLTLVALSTLWKSIGTVEQTALSVAGVSLTQPLQTAAELTTAAASGGASTLMRGGAAYLGMAAAGSTAFAQASDAPLFQRAAYATSAAVGRVAGAGPVGEVAAAMGWLGTDTPVYEGLRAGDRSLYGWRAARVQMEHDTAGYSRASVRSTTGTPPAGSAPPPPAPPSSSGSTPPPAPPSSDSVLLPVAPTTGDNGGHAPRSPLLVASGQSAAANVSAATSTATAGPPRAASNAARLSPQGSAAAPQIPAQAAVDSSPAYAPSTSQPSPDTDGGPAQAQLLPPTHTHRVYATAQLGSLPNQETGADWEYIASTATPDGYLHTFQHPQHPLTRRPELRQVASRAAMVVTQQQRRLTGPLSARLDAQSDSQGI